MIKENLIEILLFGTGGGYGESVLIHFGNDEWIVVDSCIDPYSKTSLPLEYLLERGVKIEKDVKLIICSHWHDDHILGLSQLFELSKSASFCFASATDRHKFLKLVEFDFHKAKYDTLSSSTVEFAKCIKIAQQRGTTIKTAIQDRVLLSETDNKVSYKVISLSPSDYVQNAFNHEISDLFKSYGKSNRKMTHQKPNDKSVVLYLKINKHAVLLGSDLEVSENREKGWHCILDSTTTLDQKSAVFKIPHHGSKNGYHFDIWDRLVLPDAIASLTPWNRGRKLPKKEILQKILSHTKKLYITSLNDVNSKAKKRDKGLVKFLKQNRPSLKEVRFHRGIVRTFCTLDGDDWDVELIGSGHIIDQNIINKLQ